jgi:hypothetical protein
MDQGSAIASSTLIAYGTEVSAVDADSIMQEVTWASNVHVDANVLETCTGDEFTNVSKPFRLWKSQGGPLEYTSEIIPNADLSEERVQKTRRYTIHGTEVRDLSTDHFLSGEQGLFATKPFKRFDILGEYTGYIVDEGVGGSYVATLENDYSAFNSLGVNAATCGNELRFINGYQNIEFAPNLEMKTVFIATYPHVVLVCIQDIDVGDEFLLDYGRCYVDAYMSPQNVSVVPDAVSHTPHES